MKITLIYIILFLYTYGMQYIFLPFSTRVLLGILGFIILVFTVLMNKKNFSLNKDLLIVFIFLILISIISAGSVLYNSTTDMEFIRYSISMTINVFASFFVIKMLQKLDFNLDFQSISKLLINIIFIQVLIALAMFVLPDLKYFLLGLEKMTEETFERNIYLSEIRFMGIGAAKTFTSGIINGFGLILIAIVFRLHSLSSKEIISLSIKFLIIFALGMMMARTTLVGAIFAFMIIMLPKNFNATISMFKKRGLFFSTLIIITAIALLSVMAFHPDFLLIFQYGFEMFINYFTKGSFESASTNQLMDMYVFPVELKTWIIGDAYWWNPIIDGSYYMHTDVGYSRLVFYFGLVGLFVYLSMQVFIMLKAYKYFNVNLKYYIFIVVYLLVLNLKGFTDLFWLNMIFFMAYVLNKKSIIKVDS